MEVKMALIICLSVVFIFTLGIVSCTLRDKNFKVRFDDRNKRLSRIIQEQRDELISYREAIKNTEALSLIKIELEDFILRQDKSSNEIDEAIRSFSSSAKSIETKFKWLEQRLVSRPSHLSPEEKKNFLEYMQTCSKGYAYINKDKIFVTLEDVKTALECVGTNNWGLLYETIPLEVEPCHGQNSERNQ